TNQLILSIFFFQAEDGIRAFHVTGVQTCALPISIFKQIDETLEVNVLIQEGLEVKYGDIVLYVKGNIHSILKAERLVLNIMQRMSGIASRTAEYVKELEGTCTQVLEDRKSTRLNS